MKIDKTKEKKIINERRNKLNKYKERVDEEKSIQTSYGTCQKYYRGKKYRAGQTSKILCTVFIQKKRIAKKDMGEQMGSKNMPIRISYRMNTRRCALFLQWE